MVIANIFKKDKFITNVCCDVVSRIEVQERSPTILINEVSVNCCNIVSLLTKNREVQVF